MLTNITYQTFQEYWWLLISVLAAVFVFFSFVQGGQGLLFSLGKDPEHKNHMLKELGHKWEMGFTTLVTFGGAFFASFPLFYSTSFSGAYWAWMLLLLCFVIQAVSYEFRSKATKFVSPKVYEVFLYINGTLGIFLVGCVLSTLFTGAPFNRQGWEGGFAGLEALASPVSLLLGLSLVCLSRCTAILFFLRTIEFPEFIVKARKSLLIHTVLFLVFVLSFLTLLLLSSGAQVDPQTGIVSMVSYKYLQNFIELPWVTLVFLIGLVALLYALVRTLLDKNFKLGFWFASPGVVLIVTCLFLTAGWNNTSYYHSTSTLPDSLTLANSCSSLYTLKAMSIVSLFIPVVALYISYVLEKNERIQYEFGEQRQFDLLIFSLG